jgi:acylphosphatase
VTMRCRVVVRGRVQGVGFRWFVRERAKALGLSGCVCNRSDGSVEVQAEGDQKAVDELLAALRAGPRGAEVLGLEMLAPAGADAILPNPFAIER